MAIWDKIVESVNASMNEKAEEILTEVYERGYHWYPDSKNVVPSFHIMGSKRGAEVARRYGLITSVVIGSELREAYWAVYGNIGGSNGGRIYPHGRALVFPGQGPYRGHGRGKNGMYVLPSVKAYRGHDFLKEVARRHR